MQNEIIAAHKNAQERIAMVEAKRGEMFLKVEKIVAKIWAIKIFPQKVWLFQCLKQLSGDILTMSLDVISRDIPNN
jgi:hypothetical protein